jgi:T5SS/PEP-CTERM-associated repeat protein
VVSNTYGNVGLETGSKGTVKVTGAGSQWNNSNGLYIGLYGNGILNIENGGVVNNSFAYTGHYAGSNGTVKVTGAGSQWNNSDDLFVANQGGTASLNVQDLGKVTARALSIGANGTVNLDGGTLQVSSGYIATGGAFNWTKGTLGITGNASVGSGLLASTTTLGTGKTLSVANNLTVGTGSTLQTNGGTLSAGTLTLDAQVRHFPHVSD